MKLILHHALKDLRAMRWAVALWMAALLVDTAVQALKLDRLFLDPDRATTFIQALAIGGFALVAFAWWNAAVVIQADPLDSTSAFWLTRPLSARALLASKLLLVLCLFWLLPAACATVVAAANGVRGWLLLEFAFGRLAVDAALLLPVLAAASMTHNLARLVLVLTTGFLIYATAHVAAMAPFTLVTRALGNRSSGLVVAMALSVAASLILLAHQFLTRRTKRTMGMAAAALVVTVVAGDFWPWDIFRRPDLPPVDVRVFDPAGVRLSLDPATLARSDARRDIYLRSLSSSSSNAGRFDIAGTRGKLRASGVPSGWLIRTVGGHGRMRLGTRSEMTTYTASYVGAQLVGDATQAFERAVGARIVNPDRQADGILLQLFDLPEKVFQHQEGVAGTFSAEFTLAAVRVVVSPAIPLVPGAAGRLGGIEFTVINAEPANRQPFIVVRETFPRVALYPEIRIRLLVRNRRTGEARFMQENRMRMAGFGLSVGELSLTRTVLWAGDNAPAIEPAWFAEAELVIAGLEPVGTFERQVTVNGIVLPQMYYSKK